MSAYCKNRKVALVLPLLGFCLLAEPVASADYPKRKEGLWEIKSVGLHATGLPSTQFCVGASTDQANAALDRIAATKGSCQFGAFKRAGEAYLAESVCKEGKRVVTSRSIASGDFESFYRIDTLVTYVPPLGGIKNEDKDALEGRYVGPCLSGQKPGDSVLPGMGTLNMQDGSFKPEPAPMVARKKKKNKP